MTTQTTITEALAETKVIAKKIEKKEAFIRQYLMRQRIVVDPIEGGSKAAIEREFQAIGDLTKNLIKIRMAIAKANLETHLEIDGMKLPVTAWLAWRREVAPERLMFEKAIISQIERVRIETSAKLQKAGSDMERSQWELDTCADETVLHANVEAVQARLDVLDGKLSLINATTRIEV